MTIKIISAVEFFYRGRHGGEFAREATSFNKCLCNNLHLCHLCHYCDICNHKGICGLQPRLPQVFSSLYIQALMILQTIGRYLSFERPFKCLIDCELLGFWGEKKM